MTYPLMKLPSHSLSLHKFFLCNTHTQRHFVSEFVEVCAIFKLLIGMAEPVNSDDHWHSLAPIHTSPSSRKHVNNFNLQVNDLYFESINSLVNYDKLDHHNIHSFQISPPSSGFSTSSTLTHVSFLHTLTSASSKGQLFTKCNNNSPVYATTSNTFA